jgi:hypothetical protein
MDLPLSDHRYYRIELNDSLTAPVQVLGVGHTVQARQRRAVRQRGQRALGQARREGPHRVPDLRRSSPW